MVRWAQIACLMPVMQFSVAPWRILSAQDYAKVKQAVALRSRCMPLLHQALAQCRNTGEPVLRPMAYNFTESACARVTDQFMVGDKLLVAPILEKGQRGVPFTSQRVPGALSAGKDTTAREKFMKLKWETELEFLKRKVDEYEKNWSLAWL